VLIRISLFGLYTGFSLAMLARDEYTAFAGLSIAAVTSLLINRS